MKHKVSELEGVLLDAAVALADGKQWVQISEDEVQVDGMPFWPSCMWEDGGPIIERERIMLVSFCTEDEHDDGGNLTAPARWWAAMPGSWHYSGFGEGWVEVPVSTAPDDKGHATGQTPLIAAMRAYVASKFGAEVELP